MYYEKGGPPLLLPHIHCDKHIGMLFDPTIFHDRRVDELSCKPRLRLKGSRSQSQQLYRASHVARRDCVESSLTTRHAQNPVFWSRSRLHEFFKVPVSVGPGVKKEFLVPGWENSVFAEGETFFVQNKQKLDDLMPGADKNSISVLANKLARSGSEL